MLHLVVIICAKLKFKISLYFVTSMSRLIFTKPKHKNENRKIDFDAFYLQEIERVGQSFYILTMIILPDNSVIYVSLVIIYGNLLKYITVTAHLLQ